MKNFWTTKREEKAELTAKRIMERWLEILRQQAKDFVLESNLQTAVSEEIDALLDEESAETERNIANLQHEMALLRAQLDYEQKQQGWRFQAFLPTEGKA